ncbi:MAG: hypothetical protein EOP38_14410 [Rubrivivax sp.]|nr:MAG: hypothetical protein EOP38_14410 [Rubrivivax sp.]
MMKSKPVPKSVSPRRNQGISLIELLISMVIGLVVIGAIFPTYLTSGRGHSSNAALSQISEDATLALNLIRKQIALAGYSRPFQLNNTGFSRNYNGRGLLGCDQVNFDNPKAGTIAGLTCNGGTASTDNNAIAIAYEADADNSLQTAAALPRDCTGSGIQPTPAVPGGIPAHWVAESRLYINGTALTCQGNGQASLPVAGVPLTATPEPLVNNIVSMRIRYGISTTAPTIGMDGTSFDKPTRTPNRFRTAAQIQAEDPALWRNVKAVRVCIVVRSEEEVLDSPTKYYDCNAIESTETNPARLLVTPTDRRMYRAFSTTIAIKNSL